MEVLFLIPPNVDNLNVLRDSVYGCWCKGGRLGGATSPPHPLLLMATCVRSAGFGVMVVDGLIDPAAPVKIKEKIKSIDAVVIQTSVMAFYDDCDVLGWLKELNDKIVTIVCGSMPTFLPDKSLERPEVDYIMLGESEEVLPELLRRIQNGQSLAGLKGVGYRDGEKKVNNGSAPLIADLDKLPHADWGLLDHGQTYFNPIIKRHPYVTELTTRGCFAKCVFCMSPGFYGGKIRGNSAEYIMEALRGYAKDGYKEIYFRDEMFTSLKKRNHAVFEAMIRENLDLTWICSSRVNSVDEEDLRLMKRAGCHYIKFGVESGSQKILDGMKKGITLDETRQAFALCKKMGIKTHAHFMIGNPGETWDTVHQTLAFASEIKPTTATFGMLTLYPGTPMWDTLSAKYPDLLDRFNLRLKDLHSKTFFTEEFTELTGADLEKAVKMAHRGFFLRPSYLMARLSEVRSWAQVKDLFKAGGKVIEYAVKGGD